MIVWLNFAALIMASLITAQRIRWRDYGEGLAIRHPPVRMGWPGAMTYGVALPDGSICDGMARRLTMTGRPSVWAS
jgi:hypothetical protein